MRIYLMVISLMMNIPPWQMYRPWIVVV